MEGILTSAQRQRVGGEVAMHAPVSATARELVEATKHVIDRLESLAASAAVWELWKSGQVDVSWDESRQEVAVHAVEPEEDDEAADLVTYAVPAD